MGIDISRKLLVGGDYDDVCGLLSEVDYDLEYETLEELGLSVASPYYDSSLSESMIGFELADINLDDPNWMNEILEYKEKWKELTGTPAYLIGTQHVY